MKVEAADSFFESLNTIVRSERWYDRLIELFRYDIPIFIKNVWFFRKTLWEFRPWGSTYNLELFRKSLEKTADYMQKHSHEVETSRDKKVVKMRRAIELMEHATKEDYIELAEKELGEITHHKMEFKPSKTNPGYFEMVDNDTPEESDHKDKVFYRAREIEQSQWVELWDIMKGQDKMAYFNNPENKDKAFEDFDTGEDLRSWWY